MESVALGLAAIVMILFGILIVLQKKRTYYIPEGFTTEYPADVEKNIGNPIAKLIKKITHLSAYFINMENWKDVYTTSQMTPVELARRHLQEEANKKAAAK